MSYRKTQKAVTHSVFLHPENGDRYLQIQELKRLPLACLPTPLTKLENLSRQLNGPELFIKRDDLTGLSFGGNKARKLEFIMAEAVDRKSNVVITASGLQSNWAQMTAAAARKLGMRVILVLRTAQFGEAPEVYDGNLLLDSLLDAEIKVLKGDLMDLSLVGNVMDELAEAERRKGNVPYIAGIGGDTPTGTFGYVDAIQEILSQTKTMNLNIDYIVHATAGGGTQAGLVLGTEYFRKEVNVLGVNVGLMDNDSLRNRTANLINETAKNLDIDAPINPNRILIEDKYAGYAKYGVLTEDAINAIKLLAKTEGIFLDPVYTSKAMAGLIHLIRNDYFDKEDRVLFLHTGGVVALFPYKNQLHTKP